jgi:hypothetical protein
MAQEHLAVVSIVFLVLVCVVSYVLLLRSRNPTVSEKSNQGRRGLNNQEEQQLRRRLEREAHRAERDRQELIAKEAAELAKPSLYKEKLRKREEERLERERDEASKATQAQQELEKWTSSIKVQDQGADVPIRDLGSVNEFVDYILSRKVVEIEAVADAFRLSVEQVLDRIADLEKQGKLYGVVDDRGRFVQISMDEIKMLVQGIKSMTSRQTIIQIGTSVERVLVPADSKLE